MPRCNERRANPFQDMGLLWIATVGALTLAAVLAILAVFAIYSHIQQGTESPDAGLSATGLRDALRSRGAVVQEQGEGSGGALAGTVHFLVVNGTKINGYEYVTTHDASLDVARISPDGSTITSSGSFGSSTVTISDYVAPPHWFHTGRMIVLYVGCDASLVDLLQQVLGPPFAGGEIRQPPCPTTSGNSFVG